MDTILAEIRKIPPVTRFVCISVVGLTLSTMLQLVSPYTLLYVPKLVWGKWQVWRLWSSFFLGSGGLTLIFQVMMLYRNSNELETGPYMRKSADYAWQLFWCGGAIMVLSIPMSSFLFLSPFLLCIIYLSSSLAPVGAMANLFGLITFPVKYYPYVILAMDFLLGGPQAAAQSIPGAIVGHLWWWGVWGSDLGGSRYEGEGIRGRSVGSGGLLEEVARAPSTDAHALPVFSLHSPPSIDGSPAGSMIQNELRVLVPELEEEQIRVEVYMSFHRGDWCRKHKAKADQMGTVGVQEEG
ncbi:hypothetical protein D9758_008296 [Tetrapyrgos nigripes]|uniref:Derlin n=1 Tax=Tetrapyrgos nigripes TaxID=182062 RepID=A0A8H5LGS4_9AGAR|nr:hypothetical protein D9758_008296 [Tetrapyrgos nigripes]